METKIYDTNGTASGTIELPDEIFSQRVPRALLHEVIQAYLANKRAGTHSTKTRSEVSGGGLKPWRQKHTGRARAGSIRSPLWRGGGIIFGPHPRSYRQNLPRDVRRQALKGALTAAAREDRLRVLVECTIPEAKTRRMAEIFRNHKASGKKLLVIENAKEDLFRAGRNIPDLCIRLAGEINAYDVLWAKHIFLTQAAVASLGQRF